jgi:hypothetical protein
MVIKVRKVKKIGHILGFWLLSMNFDKMVIHYPFLLTSLTIINSYKSYYFQPNFRKHFFN